MSYPSSSSMSHGPASSQSGRYIVQPQAIQSAISTHQHKSARIDKILRGDKLYDPRIEYEAAKAAFFSGKINEAEFDVAFKRFLDFGRDYDRRVADFDARKRAGQTKPGDWFKEFYGYTDEETEEYLRQGSRLTVIQTENRAHSQSRILHQSRHGRGH